MCSPQSAGRLPSSQRCIGYAWQIELLFKQWKSLLHTHVLKGTRSERSRCLLYGRLITITLLMRLCAYAAAYAAVVLRKEISFPKLILWLKRKGRFAQAIQTSTMEPLYRDLRRDMAALLCKQKRKRKTSQQLLDTSGASRERCLEGEAPPLDHAA